MKVLLLGSLAVLIFARIWRKPGELALFALILGCSLPLFNQSGTFAIGQKHSSLRLEYLLPFMGLLVLASSQSRAVPRAASRLNRVVGFAFLLHVASILRDLLYGNPPGLGISLRLLESFGCFFLFSRLTQATDIPALVNGYIGIGVALSAVCATIALSGSLNLYRFFFEYGAAGKSGRDFAYQYEYKGTALPRVWSGTADEFIYLAAVMSFVLALGARRGRMFYSACALAILLRLATSGTRSLVLAAVFGCGLGWLISTRNTGIRPIRSARVIVPLGIVLALLVAVTCVPRLSVYAGMMVQRFGETGQGLASDSQTMGAKLAWTALNNAGLRGWLLGVGWDAELGDKGYDINTPILGIYRFGVVGLMVLLALAFQVARVALALVRTQNLDAHECAIVAAVLTYSLVSVLGSGFRGFGLAENFMRLGGFVVLLSWLEVVYQERACRQRGPVRSALEPFRSRRIPPLPLRALSQPATRPGLPKRGRLQWVPARARGLPTGGALTGGRYAPWARRSTP